MFSILQRALFAFFFSKMCFLVFIDACILLQNGYIFLPPRA